MTIFIYCFRERESILDLFEKYCGARMTTTTFRFGGLRDDLPPGFADAVREFIEDFPKRIAEYEQILSANRIWLDRTVDVGRLAAKDAIALGVSGPILRGSGVRWDIRKAYPYECYAELDFIIPTGKNGDTYDRYLVRMEEMRQSLRIIRQTLDRLPEGEIRSKVPKVLKPPAGTVYHSIEAPKGELGYYVVSDGSQNPYRVHIRPPSLINLQALRPMVKGHLVADVVAIIGTLDIVLGEIDR
jgi:NADH-quinone oxidoreductase subunit D